jgi:hypothetical protein
VTNPLATVESVNAARQTVQFKANNPLFQLLPWVIVVFAVAGFLLMHRKSWAVLLALPLVLLFHGDPGPQVQAWLESDAANAYRWERRLKTSITFVAFIWGSYLVWKARRSRRGGASNGP